MEGILRRGLHIRSNPRRGSILALPWQGKDLSCLYNILGLKELLPNVSVYAIRDDRAELNFFT